MRKNKRGKELKEVSFALGAGRASGSPSGSLLFTWEVHLAGLSLLQIITD